MHELPTIGQGHAPLDVCHRTHSGVAIHLMPGCVCGGPSQLLDVVDKDGNVIGQHEVKVANHVNVHEAGGKTRSISLEQARNAGHIS